LLAAPKPPKVGALSDFGAPNANPELAGAIFDPSEAAAGVAAGLEAPKVNVDEVLDSVVAVDADAPKENVDGNEGAVVAGVDVVGLIDSEIENKRFVIAKYKLYNQMRFSSPKKVFPQNCSLIKCVPN
jgi:hypothetical protein